MSPSTVVRAGADVAQSVRHSPADVLRLVVAALLVLALLFLELLFGDTLVAFASDLLRGLEAVPSWIVDVIVIGTRLVVLGVVGVGLVRMLARRQWRPLITTAVAGALAIVVFAVLDAVVQTDDGLDPIDVDGDLGPLSTDDSFSFVGVAAVAGILTALAPWVGRRWRKAGWLIALGLMISTFVQAPVSFDAALALAVGWMCGAAVLVVGGAPSRRPTPQAVIDGLRAVGLPVHGLEQAGVDARGSTPYFGVAADGSRLFVKVLGTDERSADLLFRLYRRLSPHDLGDARPFESLRRSVEHEAFVALTAAGLGVRTPRLRAFATAAPNGYVLAYDVIDGRSLDRLDPGEVSDELLAAIWSLVGDLRQHRIAHRDLRLANVFVDDAGSAWLIDFGFSEVAATDLLLAADVAELVASSSLCVGATRAVAQAARTVDRATLVRAAERLRPWGLSGATRTALRGRPGLLDDVRSSLAAAISDGGPRR